MLERLYWWIGERLGYVEPETPVDGELAGAIKCVVPLDTPFARHLRETDYELSRLTDAAKGPV